MLKKILGKWLIHLCETWWVERYDAVLQFAINLPDIVESFTKISEWKTPIVSKDKASVFITSLRSSDFLVGLYCLSDILSLTRSFSVILQGKSINLSRASDLVLSVIQTWGDSTTRSDWKFWDYFCSNRRNESKSRSLEFVVFKREEKVAVQRTTKNIIVFQLILLYSIKLFKIWGSDLLQTCWISNLIQKKVIELENADKIALASTFSKQFGHLPNLPINEISLRAELDHWKTRCVRMDKA